MPNSHAYDRETKVLDTKEIKLRLKRHEVEQARKAAHRTPRILKPGDRAAKAGHYRVVSVTGDVYLAKGQKARMPKSQVVFMEID